MDIGDKNRIAILLRTIALLGNLSPTLTPPELENPESPGYPTELNAVIAWLNERNYLTAACSICGKPGFSAQTYFFEPVNTCPHCFCEGVALSEDFFAAEKKKVEAAGFVEATEAAQHFRSFADLEKLNSGKLIDSYDAGAIHMQSIRWAIETLKKRNELKK